MILSDLLPMKKNFRFFIDIRMNSDLFLHQKMSGNQLLLRIQKELRMYTVQDQSCTQNHTIPSAYKFSAGGTVSVVSTDEKEILTIYKNMVELIKYKVESFDDVCVKISPKNNFVLCCINRKSKSSYFGENVLILFNLNEKTGKVLDIKFPLSYTFVNAGYAVCYGQQPAKVAVYGYDGTPTKRFPEGVKNRLYFNNHNNVACFAGFDNLNGIIETMDGQTQKLISRIKMKGASEIHWSPCGSYFIVAITHALRVDNMIVVYDYFGRKVNEMKFDKLIGCDWIGDKEPFKVLERPKELIIF